MNVMLDFICMAPVDLSGAHRKRKKQNEKFLLKVGFEPTALRSDALLTELTGFGCKLYYLNNLHVYMYFLYQCIYWYKFENDGLKRILSFKCSVLCYVLENSYIVQIVKRRTNHVFAFNMQNTIKHSI